MMTSAIDNKILFAGVPTVPMTPMFLAKPDIVHRSIDTDKPSQGPLRQIFKRFGYRYI